MVRANQIALLSVAALLTFFWWPVFNPSFAMEDSWFFRSSIISLQDIWNSLFYLEFGYYRPLRSIFLRIFWPMGGVPSATLFHFLVFLIFASSMAIFQSLHRARGLLLSAVISLALGMSSIFHKPLFWIIGMHTILCLFFILCGLQAALQEKRGKRDFFVLLALLSRELGLLAIPAFLWIDWFQAQPFTIKQYLKRNTIFLFQIGLALFVFLSLGAADPTFRFSLKANEFLIQISTYLSIFVWPMSSDFVSPPKGLIFWGSLVLLPLVFFLSFRIIKNNRAEFFWPLLFYAGIFPLAFFGPAIHPEYLFLSVLGLYGTLAVSISSLKKAWWLLFCVLCLGQSMHHSYFLMPKTQQKYSSHWPLMMEWEKTFLSFLATLPEGKIIVVKRIASFERFPLSAHQIFLDEFIKHKARQYILWDTESLPALAKSATLKTRALKHSILWQVLPRDRFVVVEEEESGWTILPSYLQP